MPAAMNGDHVSKRRKLNKSGEASNSSKRRVRTTKDAATVENDTSATQVERLESEIAQSRRNFNNIATLIHMATRAEYPVFLTATLSLCRVFVRLISAGDISEVPNGDDNEQVITAWLKQQYEEYKTILLNLLRVPDASIQSTVLTLVMRLVQQEVLHLKRKKLNSWIYPGLFAKTVPVLIGGLEDNEQLLMEFASKYVLQYDDVRFYTFDNIASYVSDDPSPIELDNVIMLMGEVNHVPSTLKDHLVKPSTEVRDRVHSVTAHRRKAQDAWLAILRSDLSVSQRKTVLRIMSHVIAPWFIKPEMLMDFLTDSYNSGGSSSLLALSGLFYLIQERNLDYPQFYPKLYSLLDNDLLHSKHRSRFFRLLNTFLSSTHLPAALVASFIKRLSRLAMSAPPAAIVAIVPWIYNLLKTHPACTFMTHREIKDEGFKAQLAAEGMEDPFDMSEPDPMLTDAIESSLWELETLQSHYHPNVASLAKITSEQFTKQSYNIEDFLDYSYQSMLDAELGKEVKKAPVVEFQIPKRIFSNRGVEEDGGMDGNILRRLWRF